MYWQMLGLWALVDLSGPARTRCRACDRTAGKSRLIMSPGSPAVLNKALTLGSLRVMRRGARGSGVPVNPARVREARIEAGLSLAQVAGDDVSRTFIHFVEQGRSRPSQNVL